MSAPTIPELLPCPFCNGEACINSEPNRVWRRVQCTGCETEQADSHSLEEAVALWNTRAALAAPASPWLPIESLPAEGEFLFYLPGERRKIQAAQVRPNVTTIGGCFAFDLTKPTHYMPMPPLPAGPVEQGEPT